jgi:hypothetical protein
MSKPILGQERILFEKLSKFSINFL